MCDTVNFVVLLYKGTTSANFGKMVLLSTVVALHAIGWAILVMLILSAMLVTLGSAMHHF